ncbi:hypothetical protein OH76DRAFT_1096705 [Lentinus brumalis]|uniref:Uncharacterized protein n=1 Tax=Lentinus brumalis TaxID=2498619 RepID=A0A371CVQ8_9APHY|nr:hypothetical protein OH76DRAFT_1096705 [Polyporus brumalis]
MPVTFQVAPHAAEEHDPFSWVRSADDVLKSACRQQWMHCTELLQSSVTTAEMPALVPKANGFVEAVLTAYKKHNHLKISADDVWTSILSQLNFYINAHADELRQYFVAHEGKKKLTVSAVGTRYTVDFGDMARQMTLKIQDNVVDKTLVDWILPNFTTTTVKDTTVCAILMMSSLKSYFDYHMTCMCGIPSVTLEGERADWEKLLARLDRLPELGEEPAVWARMLRPILTRFVSAFDGEPDTKFWSEVAHSHERFYGPEDLSGWITAFCVWSSTGTWQAGALSDITSPRSPRPVTDEMDWRAKEESFQLGRRYLLDGVSYPPLSVSQIAEGFCEVDVLLDDNGVEYECMMVAGHVAMSMSSSGKGQQNDTLSPASHWFMFVKGKREVEDPYQHMDGKEYRYRREDAVKPRRRAGWGSLCGGCVIA